MQSYLYTIEHIAL